MSASLLLSPSILFLVVPLVPASPHVNIPLFIFFNSFNSFRLALTAVVPAVLLLRVSRFDHGPVVMRGRASRVRHMWKIV